MIAGAAPASILPSPSLSSRDEPAVRQDSSRLSIVCSRALGAGPVTSTPAMAGSVVPAARRSVVAALFIAPVSDGRSCTDRAATLLSSSSTRWTEPYVHSLSAEPNEGAGLLFQLTSLPDAGSASCGWSSALRKPRHSKSPVPFVGRRGSTFGLRIGRSPAE